VTQTTTKHRRYERQRPSVTPPHVSLGDLRLAVGLTIDQLIERVEEETGRRYTRGAISAVENGHRGASEELLEGLALAYGLRRDALTTTYEPRKFDQVPA
jgi:hypothetical protein